MLLNANERAHIPVYTTKENVLGAFQFSEQASQKKVSAAIDPFKYNQHLNNIFYTPTPLNIANNNNNTPFTNPQNRQVGSLRDSPIVYAGPHIMQPNLQSSQNDLTALWSKTKSYADLKQQSDKQKEKFFEPRSNWTSYSSYEQDAAAALNSPTPQTRQTYAIYK